MTTPSNEALRAAEIVIYAVENYCLGDGTKVSPEQAAQIIEREMGVKELREALEQIKTWTSGFASDFENRIHATAEKALRRGEK